MFVITTQTHILYIKTQWVFCAELIDELGGARNVKFGAQVNNNESTIKFEDLSEIFTPRRDR